MCGIFGLTISPSVKRKGTKKYIEALLSSMEVNGRQASGLAVMLNSTIKVIKGNLPASEFIKTEEYKSFANNYFDYATAIIGHCRLPTKGSELNNVNNHPIVTERIVGIHKGVLSNDEELWKKEGNHTDRKGEVDSEIIFSLLSKEFLEVQEDSITKISRVAKKLEGSVVAAFFSKLHPDFMWLFKTTGGSVSMLRLYSADAWVFGDTFELKRALTKMNHDVSITGCTIPDNVGVRFNLKTDKIYAFKLD